MDFQEDKSSIMKFSARRVYIVGYLFIVQNMFKFIVYVYLYKLF